MTRLAETDAGIRQLHARYIDAVWRKDRDAFVDCFTAAGEWKIAGRHLQGRDAIGDTIATLLASAERVQLIFGPPLLDMVEDGAIGRMMVTELVKLTDGGGAMTLGVYHDRYAEEDGRWRFARRHFALYYRGSPDLSAAMTDCPDYGPFPQMPGPDEPTYTRRAD